MSPVPALESSRRLLQVAPPGITSCGQTPNGDPLCANAQPAPVLISVAVVLLAVVAIVILLLVTMKLVSVGLSRAHERQDTQQDHAAAAATTLTSIQLEGAKLVIFPGEDQPRVLAMPCDLVSGEGELAAKPEVCWSVEALKASDTMARIEEPASPDDSSNSSVGLAER